MSALLTPCLAYMELRPYLTATYFLGFIMLSVLAAYKCKFLKRSCRSRRNRRRRKPRTHYYYLNKSSAEQMAENNVVDPLIGEGVELGDGKLITNGKGQKRSRKGKP